MNPEKIKEIAGQQSWVFERFHGNMNVMRFTRDGTMVDVWFKNMTVGIYEQGEDQRFLNNVNEEDLIELFGNPSYIPMYKLPKDYD